MVFSYQANDMNNASNGVILLLEVGDKVDIYLPISGCWIMSITTALSAGICSSSLKYSLSQ